MKTAIIIGSGNVANVFGRRMMECGMDIVQVCGTNHADTASLAEALKADHCQSIDDIRHDADIYLLAVNDASIEEISKTLHKVSGCHVHCSGSTSITILKSEDRGVIWPLRSIKKGSELDWPNVSLVVETSSRQTVDLAHLLGGKVIQMDSMQRESAHLTAVVLNNFVNHLIHVADVLTEEVGIDRGLFDDILQNTIQKNLDSKAALNQTGPATRGDLEVIRRHLSMLETLPDFKKIYETISSSIIKSLNGKKL